MQRGGRPPRARRPGYRNAGTVEFLFDPESAASSSWRSTPASRSSIRSPRSTTGLDLVKLQLHVARGGRLEGEPPASRGHAIEVRLNAEDPEHDFAPAPGPCRPTSGRRRARGSGSTPGVVEGDDIAPEFDSMIAKIIAWGRDRDEALARLPRAIAAVDGRHRGRHHQQGVPARAARAPRGASRGLRHRLARPPGRAGKHLAGRTATRSSAPGRDRGLRRRGRPGAGAVLRRGGAGAARGVRSEPGRESASAIAGIVYEVRVLRIGRRTLPGRRGGRRIEDVAFDRLGSLRAAPDRLGQAVPRRSRSSRVPDHLSRSKASATRIPRRRRALCGRLRPRWSSPSPCGPGDEVEVRRPRWSSWRSMKMETPFAAPVPPGRSATCSRRPDVQVDAGHAARPVRARWSGRLPAGTRSRASTARLRSGPDRGRARGSCRRMLRDPARRLTLGYDVEIPETRPADRGAARPVRARSRPTIRS